MGRFVDMTGWVMSEHGVPDSRWTVIKRAEDYIRPSGGKSVAWLCECSCKKHTRQIVLGNALRNGRSKSCGCLHNELFIKNIKKYYETNYNLIGMTFNRLTVIAPAEEPKTAQNHRKRYWLCECSCSEHNRIVVSTERLINGNTQSCGCLNKDNIYKRCKKYNKYDISGEYGIGLTSNTNKAFYFDIEDYDKIKNYCWYEDDKGYIVSKTKDKNVKLHRIVMDAPKDKQVDHIHGKATRHDNRKNNLRLATNQQNSFNKGIYATNTSGASGVWWHKQLQKWCAEIKINNKKIHLGVFVNFDDAVNARREAEEKYFGEFSYDNSMGENNNELQQSS